MQRFIGPALATFCGVATAVAALQPEFQKQAAEREGVHVEQFQQQHNGAIPPTSRDPEIPAIDNNKSIGVEVKERLQEAKDEAMSDIQHARAHAKNEIQQAKTEVAPQTAWWGLGLFGASQGGAESPKEDGKTN
ncbi:hypothetical protein E4T42_09546 [Aureobasidium subglaciale]|nr:hypothetical protein E4T42_09546 [Aureobasidium subglaciale]